MEIGNGVYRDEMCEKHREDVLTIVRIGRMIEVQLGRRRHTRGGIEMSRDELRWCAGYAALVLVLGSAAGALVLRMCCWLLASSHGC